MKGSPAAWPGESSSRQMEIDMMELEKGRGLPGAPRRKLGGAPLTSGRRLNALQLQPLVPPQVTHFMQVPLRTRVKFPHSPQASPS